MTNEDRYDSYGFSRLCTAAHKLAEERNDEAYSSYYPCSLFAKLLEVICVQSCLREFLQKWCHIFVRAVGGTCADHSIRVFPSHPTFSLVRSSFTA